MSKADKIETLETQDASLAQLASVFLKLGTTAFGGPAAHLAIMEDEFVRRRRWITHAEFLDRIATANLIPGPSSTEVAIFVGQLKQGWLGLVVAGVCFIIPAALLVSAIAWAYVRFGSLPSVESILNAIKPAVVAIVVQALGKMGRAGIKTVPLAMVAALAVGLSVMAVNPVFILIVSALIAASAALVTKDRLLGFGLLKFTVVVRGAAILATGGAAALTAPARLIGLFLSFMKIGATVFGSGYVLLAFLRTEFVERLHWLSEKQLIDAVAVGQFTPGPLFTTATFIGFIVAGLPGAIVATVAIFLPGFLLVAVSGPFLPRLRRSPAMAAALDGVIAGSLALMAVVTWQLGRASLVELRSLIIFGLSLVALLRFRLNTAWVVAGAALVGWITR